MPGEAWAHSSCGASRPSGAWSTRPAPRSPSRPSCLVLPSGRCQDRGVVANQDVGRCGPARLPATAILQKNLSKHLPQPAFCKWASNIQPTKPSGFCRPALLFPSLCIGGSGRRGDPSASRLARRPLPPYYSPRRLLPPSCSTAASSLTPAMQSSAKSAAQEP